MKEVERLPLRDFTRYCMSIAQVPSSYLAGLTIEEQLLWLCSFLTNQVIPTVNNNGEAVEELQELYRLLKDYVDNYFDNLDIQEEVNTKLEEMAQSGELAELIAQYLEAQAVIGFNNNAGLAAAENLAAGSFAKTMGKLTYNDGKGAFYRIRTRTNADVPDGDTLIALTNTENLVAEMIPYSRNYDLDSKINENVQDLQDQIDNIKVQGIVTPLWDPIYIDGVNGDDNNDGTSQETAFKTLDPVIKMVEKGKLKLDLYFAGNQTYDMSKFQALNSMSIHFVTFGDYGNVVLDYGVPTESVSNYNCHFNYGGNENRQIIVTGCSYIYWDGGSITGKYTTFDTLFSLWGAGADMQEGNIYKGIKLRNSSFNTLNETTFGSIDMETSSLYCYKPHFITSSDYNKGEFPKIFFRLLNSHITIVGTCNINTDNNSYEKMLEVTGSTFNMGSQLSEAGSDPTAFITASTINLSQVMINQTRWNALKSRAGTISVTGSMLMDNNSYVTA